MAQFLSKPFGMTPNGEKINEYIISNPGGLAVSVLNYGCIIKNIWVPTKRGPVDVVLGHDTYADYVKDFESSGSTCCGAFVGRYANRIENAVFNVGGKTYQLEANNGKNHLHGTFPRKLYEVKTFGDTLLLEAESPDGEDGFPGNLKISVRYILTEDNALRMDYRVSSDADTIINLTNHTYFNLDGGGDVLGQKLRIYASRYLEGNNETCPSGNILPVAGTPMDFRRPAPIGSRLDADFEARRKVLEAENKHWRFVAKLENGKASVGLQEVGANHPFYGLEGSNNIILLTTARYKEYPMMIQGYGAGAGVTAAGVFADIMSIANV